MKKTLFRALPIVAIVIIGGVLTYAFLSGAMRKHTVVPLPPLSNEEISHSFPEAQSASSTVLFEYLQVMDGCGPYYNGTCVNLRSGPGTEFPSVAKLRNGMVLKVVDATSTEGHVWYKIGFDNSIRYPERVTSDWYVASDYVKLFADEGDEVSWNNVFASNNKRILVDLSEQTLYAYDGDTLFMQQPISTGLDGTPTPLGTFRIYKKTPSRYMQGPLPGISDQYYDLPGVPWNLYFTLDGAVIHGAYWHDHFGHQWSHGCVNLPPDKAEELYKWADINTKVTVQK